MVWPVTIAVVGTGLRGYTFAGYAQRFPDPVRAVAVADPRVERRDVLADRLGVTADRRFVDWRELAARPPLADAVVVTTPDHEHVGPARRFAELGYHVLLEKPIEPTAAECVALVEAVEATGVIFAVCHVLRYAAYTDAVRQAVRDGRIGRLVGVAHLEPVGWWHFAHSYVRGNWRRSQESGPSLLTKCCHDLDWLRYLVGQPPVRVSSVGGLHHFTSANRPDGAADRCLDCAVESRCPYSAVRLYLGCLGDPRRERWPLSVVTTDLTEYGVRLALREGPYGRCVYACDNNVADHQVVTVEFAGGVTATLTMSAFTPMGRRRTLVMGYPRLSGRRRRAGHGHPFRQREGKQDYGCRGRGGPGRWPRRRRLRRYGRVHRGRGDPGPVIGTVRTTRVAGRSPHGVRRRTQPAHRPCRTRRAGGVERVRDGSRQRDQVDRAVGRIGATNRHARS